MSKHTFNYANILKYLLQTVVNISQNPKRSSWEGPQRSEIFQWICPAYSWGQEVVEVVTFSVTEQKQALCWLSSTLSKRIQAVQGYWVNHSFTYLFIHLLAHSINTYLLSIFSRWVIYRLGLGTHCEQKRSDITWLFCLLQY